MQHNSFFKETKLPHGIIAMEPWGSRKLHQSRQGSISTLRSSLSRDQQQQQHPRYPLLLPRGFLPIESSSRRPNISNPNSPFIRRDLGSRASFSGLPLHQPVQLENTYKTEPEKGCLFKASKVQKLVQAMLDSYLDGASYNAASGSHLSQILSDMVKSKVKEMIPPRYKLVCQVVVGQNRNQGLRVASRCLWDSQHDDFAVAMFQNHSLFTLVIVHGVYCE
uniref:Tctex1 domain-containing protein 4 n=1 Tax=Oncorhynchus mykiss TaxID=8022 RepID=A0A8C7PLT4_ONCMY